MKKLSIIQFIAAVLLLIALADLPYGYYTFLRIAITITAVVNVIAEYQSQSKFWMIVFILVGILFNPIIPIYLNRETWMPIDIISSITFIIYGVFLIAKKRPNKE